MDIELKISGCEFHFENLEELEKFEDKADSDYSELKDAIEAARAAATEKEEEPCDFLQDLVDTVTAISEKLDDINERMIDVENCVYSHNRKQKHNRK